MHASLTNPDSRPLPAGWAEHFDSQRTIWYYVDLNSEPPRVAFIHPGDTAQPLSAPILGMGCPPQNRDSQRPVGPRESVPQTRQATVAQQLYASSISSSSRASSSSSLLLADSEVTSSFESSFSSHSTTSVPPTSTANVGSPHARYYLNDTSPSRRVSGNEPQPPSSRGLAFRRASQDLIAPFTANAFYHHSVTSTPPPQAHIPPTFTKDGALETHLQPVALSIPEKDHYSRACLDTRNSPLSPAIASSSVAGYFANNNLYTATTEDNLMVMPTQTTDQASNRHRTAPIDVSCLSDSQPIPPGHFQSRRNISTVTNQAIIQPKPTRPLKGVNLNLQVQVAGEALVPESIAHVKTKKTAPLKTFSLATGKNLFLKCQTGREGGMTDESL